MTEACHVQWPAIIKHAGDDELTYLQNENQLAAVSISGDFDTGDQLIDTNGNVFTSSSIRSARLPDRDISLNEVLGLVKAHAAQSGSCCVAKLFAPSIREALELVGAMTDD